MMDIWAVEIDILDEPIVVASHTPEGAVTRALFQAYITNKLRLEKITYTVRKPTINQIKQFKKDFPYANISDQYLLV